MRKHRVIIIAAACAIIATEFLIGVFLLSPYSRAPVNPASTPHPLPPTWTPTPAKSLYDRARRCVDAAQWIEASIKNMNEATKINNTIANKKNPSIRMFANAEKQYDALVVSQSNLETTRDTEPINDTLVGSFQASSLFMWHMRVAIEDNSFRRIDQAIVYRNRAAALMKYAEAQMNALIDICKPEIKFIAPSTSF